MSESTMVPFMFPMMFPYPVESATQEVRVQQLERALVMSLDVLQSIVERLNSKFGPDFLGDELRHLTGFGVDAELDGFIGKIDAAIKEGRNPAAVREYRDAFGCTWDDAHKAIGQWTSQPREKKLRWLRLAKFIKALNADPS